MFNSKELQELDFTIAAQIEARHAKGTQISNDIIALEKRIRSLPITYYKEIVHETPLINDVIQRESLSWAADKHGNKRIIYDCYKLHPNGSTEIVYRNSLSEVPLQIRLESENFLPIFYKGLLESLKKEI
jgi:hypothetical protein